MNKNIKTETAEGKAPKLGWAPADARARVLSGLDAATGQLTGQQKQYWADLPSEEFSEQPSTSNKIVNNADGSTEYRQLAPYGGTWKDPSTGSIWVNGAVRP
jgi:hypothetical protein